MNLADLDPRRNDETASTMNLKFDGSDAFCFDNGKHISFDLIGSESVKGRKLMAAYIKKQQMKAKTKRKIEKVTVNQIMTVTEDNERDLAEMYSKMTTGCSNVYFDDALPAGQDAETEMTFSEKNIHKLYSSQIWIMRQVKEYIEDTTNFLPQTVLDSYSGQDNTHGSQQPKRKKA